MPFRSLFKPTVFAVTALSVVLVTACAAPTPTPLPTDTPTPTALPLGPSVLIYNTLLVSLVSPPQAAVGDEVEFQLALANIGDKAITFYHKADLAQFILTQNGKQVMNSYDQLEFGDVKYTNTLGPGQTRRWETGFQVGTFYGVLIDKAGNPLPPGKYQLYGIAHLSNVDDGNYQTFETPPTSIEIVPAAPTPTPGS